MPIIKTISETDKKDGAIAGIKKSFNEFKTESKNAARHIKSKNGNIRRVRVIVKESFSGFFSKPYAISFVICGANIIPKTHTIKSTKISVVNIALKSFSVSFFSFVARYSLNTGTNEED